MQRLLYINIIYEYNAVVWFSHIDLCLPMNRIDKPKKNTLCLVNSEYQITGLIKNENGLIFSHLEKISHLY